MKPKILLVMVLLAVTAFGADSGPQAAKSPYIVVTIPVKVGHLANQQDGGVADELAKFLNKHPGWRIISVVPICNYFGSGPGDSRSGLTTTVVVVFEVPGTKT